MTNKLIVIISMCCSFISMSFSMSSHADDAKGLSVGVGVVEARTLYYGHTGNGGLFEGGYDFNELYSIDAKVVRAGSDDFELNFLGVDIGPTFNSSWIRVYGKVGVAEITSRDPDVINANSEEYENLKASRRTSFALGAGVRFTPFSEHSGVYAKAEFIGEASAPLYAPFGMFLILGYKF